MKIFRIILLQLSLIAFLPANPEPTSLRILSYNIHHGAGLDGKLDLERIARVIKSAKPDLVSLQEVDRRTKRSGGVDQAARLAELTGMTPIYGSSMAFQGGQYGNAILTRLKIVSSKTLPLPGEPRSALCATLEDPGKFPRFHFIATHLDTKPNPRQASPPLIEKMIKSLTRHPAILAGDLNARPESPTMTSFLKTWSNATSAPAFLTSPANQPKSQIDYILFRDSGDWKVLEKQVLPEAVASDHRPVLAVLAWTGKKEVDQ
jgi:endonuclease/exonuclease/phosphatase family metal-dependent hydrolase